MKIWRQLIWVALISSSAVTFAQKSAAKSPSPAPIHTQFFANKVIFSNGLETLEKALDASPGDVIEYSATHRNISKQRLQEVDFAIPVPWGTRLWEGSVQPADGQLLSNSKGEQRVQWRVAKFEPGQSLSLKLRVRIEPDASLKPPPAPNPFKPQRPELRR
jgi:hypothetical protein